MSAPARIDVVPAPPLLDSARLAGRLAVVVDVLRATTVEAMALAAGAAGILPVAEVEEARRLAAERPGSLLAGEREGLRLPGFDLGNSPTEFTAERVRGRTVIQCSTNGTGLLAAAAPAARVIAAAFVNLSAAVACAAAAESVTVLCAGKLGRPCLEDLALAGGLVERLAGPDTRLGEGARLARSVWIGEGRDPAAVLRNAGHGRYLASIGFAGDLEAAARVDAVTIVPELRDGLLVAG